MMSAKVEVDQDIEIMLDEIAKKQDMYNLILFNDDHHDMIQVAKQLIKAVKCTREKALRIMAEAHTSGQAIALTGTKDAAKQAGNVLMEIDLAIDIVKA
jgi:ATP-dependent Clp protease adaptor protein ClpS